MRMKLTERIQELLYLEEDGFTIHAVSKEIPDQGFMVGVGRDEDGTLDVFSVTELTSAGVRDRIIRFVANNVEMLSLPFNYLGYWYDYETDLAYVEISANFSKKSDAFTEAKSYNQISIYDIDNDEVIYL